MTGPSRILRGVKGPARSNAITVANSKLGGGVIHANTNGTTRKKSSSTYLKLCRALFSFSERFRCLVLEAFRNRVMASIYKPNGQSQPQKSLPKTIGIIKITANTRSCHTG